MTAVPHPLATSLMQRLIDRRLTLALAESVTGGALASAITTVPGASQAFRGGAVVYTRAAKVALAGVDPDLLATFSTVASETSLALAVGIRDRLQASLGFGITGNAGPTTEGDAPIGIVHWAITGPAGHRRGSEQFEGERTAIIGQAVDAALAALLAYVEAMPGAAA